MICVLTGGTGGAKFVDGLRQIMPEEEITLVVNTGDDLLWWGLYVSPDIDSITYVLSGMLSRERGWGVKGDTFLCLQAMGQLGEPTWFHTGDRDLAMHLLRSRHMAEGKTLSEATTIVSGKLGVRAHILPMSDSRVETRVDTPAGELSFEEYFVQRWYQDPVNSVRFAGASDAEPAPGVIEAIEAADAILIAPSNPITSIGPILAVPGIREALMSTKAKIGAVSPIVGGAAVNGPAGILMTAQGLPCSIAGVAQAYKDFLDVLICDTRDARPAEALRKTGLRVQCAQTIMRTPEDKAALARTALALVAGSSPSGQGSTGRSVSSAATSHDSNDSSARDASAHDDPSSDLRADEAASSNESPASESSGSTSTTDTSSTDQASTDQDPATEPQVSRPFTRFQPVDKPS
jgi:LPPG:FO 2-phospho-L-lactate transferase